MTQSTPELEVRTEAHPLKWAELSEGQRKAGGMVKALVNKFLAELPDKPERVAAPRGIEAVLPRIDLHRTTNRVILIDGSRGSGKTALLVSLIHEWSEAVRGFGPEGEKLAGPDYRVLPVGVVDLRPMPDATSVLFSIVGSFHKLVDLLESEAGTPPDTFGGGGDPSRLRQTWDRLLRSVSTWKRDLAERAKDLDPEQFVAEFTEIEQRRLHLDKAFAEFMDELAWSFAARTRSVPLLLVAIDDADLNGTLSLELLDLLRKLWHPNVAYLLTGDKSLFRLGVRCDFRKMFPHGEVRTAKASRASAEAVHEDWAEQIVEKLLPQGHLCTIPELTPEERFLFINDHLESVLAPSERRTGGLAAGKEHGTHRTVRLSEEKGRSLRSLADFMRAQPQTKESLPAHFRPLLALREWIAQNAGEFPAELPAFFRRLNGGTNDLIAEGPDGGPVLANAKLRLRIRSGKAHFVQKSPEYLHAFIARPLRFGATVGDETEPTRTELAAVLLAANVVYDGDGEVPQPMIAKLSEAWLAASFVFDVGANRHIWRAWTIPDGWSPECQYICFAAWEQVVEAMLAGSPERRGDTDAWARVFSRVVCDVGLRRQGCTYLTDAKVGWSHESLSWEAIISDVGTLASGSGPVSRWANCGFWLIAAPEIGLPVPVSNRLLSAFFDLPDCEIASLVKLRRDTLRTVRFGGDAKAESEAFLSTKFSAHPWMTKLQPTPKQRPHAAEPATEPSIGAAPAPKRKTEPREKPRRRVRLARRAVPTSDPQG